MKTYKTRKQALKAFAAVKEKNPNAKLFRREGIYTQPGKGIVSVLEWVIR